MKKTALSLLLLAIPAVALAGASASNFRKGDRSVGENYWNANSTIDNKMETAWMVPGESPNMGEWIMIDAPKGTLEGIRIVNGWAKDEASWADHPRVKGLRVDVLCCTGDPQMSTQGTKTVAVEDTMEWQTLPVGLDIGNEYFGGKVKIFVTEIYEGKDFPNLAISELRLQMKEFDGPSAYNPSGASEEANGTMLLDLMDEDNKTTWQATSAGAKFSLEPNGVGPSSLRWVHAKDKTFDRAKVVKVTINQMSVTTEVPNKDGQHFVEIPAPFGYNGSGFGDVEVEVVEVYPGTSNAGTLAVGDVLLYGSTISEF